MAPAMGPTTALAMCAAAFVGWRVPSQRTQSFESDEPEVPDSTKDNEASDPGTDVVPSGISISNDVCENAVVQEHIWQHQNATSKTTGLSDNLGDGAMDNDWERGSGAFEFAHDSKVMLRDTSTSFDHEGSRNVQPSCMFPVVDGDDDFNSLCNSDSNKESSPFDYESFFELSNGSGFEQGECCRVPSEFVNKLEFLTSDLSLESEAVVHNNEFGSLTEFAIMETETVSEVKEPESSNSSDLSVESEAVLHDDEFGSLMEVEIMEKETVSAVPQRSHDVLDIRADQDLARPEDDIAAGWNTERHDQSNIFQGMPDKFFEFLLWSWQACCTECRKVLSDDNLDKALEVLHQQWHSCLAISRSVLGEELFLKVSEVMARWWQVVLLCVASLIDLVLFGVFGRVLFGKCCRRGTRREPVPAEFDVADTKKNADDCEKPILPSDEQIETARSGTPQALVPITDVQRESACEGGSVDAMKGQCSPFNPIRFSRLPTPCRAVAAVGCASSQNMVTTSVSAESA